MPASASETNGPTAGNSRFDRKWVGARRVLVAAEDIFYLEGGAAWSSWLAADCEAHLILCEAVHARQQGRRWQRMVYYAMEHVLNDHAPIDPANCTDVCNGKMVPAELRVA